jgi:hypothetical protein
MSFVRRSPQSRPAGDKGTGKKNKLLVKQSLEITTRHAFGDYASKVSLDR